MRPGISHWPLASMIRARRGTGHSPAEPAQRIRLPRIRVTALLTGPRPVPSHRVARTMATVGSGAGASRSGGGLPPQALKTSVNVRTEKPIEGKSCIPCAPGAGGRRGTTAVWGSAPTGTHLKMRGKNAIGRDFRDYLDRDQEHYARRC